MRSSNLYFRSVGRNSKLLLNVPPTKDGVLHATDVARLAGCADRLRAIFAVDKAAMKEAVFISGGAGYSSTASIDLGRDESIGVVGLEEPIEQQGQSMKS